MNRIILLEQFRDFTKSATADIILPVCMQRGDTEQEYRAADNYLMRLTDSSAAKKKAPYIIHQIVTGKDGQPKGEKEYARASTRSIFCVYNDDEQEGALALLNLMERVRICLLKQVVIGHQFELDLEAGLETFVYTEDTAPFYAGEMMGTWKLPAIKREVGIL